jgi:hypothetical protein
MLTGALPPPGGTPVSVGARRGVARQPACRPGLRLAFSRGLGAPHPSCATLAQPARRSPATRHGADALSATPRWPGALASAVARARRLPDAFDAPRRAASGARAHRESAGLARSCIHGIARGRGPGPGLVGRDPRRHGRGRYPCWPRGGTAGAFGSGVSQRPPSTPGGQVPRGAVTRWTARRLAAHAWGSRRCRARPCPPLPAWVACTLRPWRRRTRLGAGCPLRAGQTPALGKTAPAGGATAGICCVACRRLAKVSREASPAGAGRPLARGVRGRGRTSSPPHARMACAFSRLPSPPPQRLALRRTGPGGRETG